MYTINPKMKLNWKTSSCEGKHEKMFSPKESRKRENKKNRTRQIENKYQDDKFKAKHINNHSDISDLNTPEFAKLN